MNDINQFVTFLIYVSLGLVTCMVVTFIGVWIKLKLEDIIKKILKKP